MLELRHVHKAYTTAGFEQVALDDVSVSFRDSEFVAVLGPSGSGKTTMLNILGGLDHADSGDIVINGISTKDYRAKDWDTYRNHRVGFVFQSYNLIPHQTILSNVELALTLSGVGRAERRRRATEALEAVGLGEHVNKRPNQLSGGQMQRVAIARALVNNPDIVLADEPTGALDTQTGIQVMDILQQVARDRLVVMVTHNPELAEEYATRIVYLRDGRITDDTDPVAPETADTVAARRAPRHLRDTRSVGKGKRASMGLLTALSLSFNNLMTKKGRTFMTAFAGSIGIIGIAAILALSNGVNNYIAKTEQDTLSSYPVQLTESSADLTSLLGTMMGGAAGDSDDASADDGLPAGTDLIPEATTVSSMVGEVQSNDLAAFKAYLDGGQSGVEGYVSTISYQYGVTPLVYAADTSDGVTRLGNPLSVGTGSSSMAAARSSLGLMGGSSTFEELLDDRELLDSQYDVLAGSWPEAADEAVLVLGTDGTISDYTLYALGVLDPDELRTLVQSIGSSDAQVEVPDTHVDLTYDDALDLTFKVIGAHAVYQRNAEAGTWTDMSDDTDFMREAVDAGMTLRIVGVVRPNATTSTGSLQEGVAYTHALTQQLMSEAASSEIVREQLASPDVDVFTGETFEALRDASGMSFDMSSIFTVDEDALRDAFSFDSSVLEGLSADGGTGELDLSGMDLSTLDLSTLDLSSVDTSQLGTVFSAEAIARLVAEAPRPDLTQLLEDVDPARTAATQEAVERLVEGFDTYFVANSARYQLASGASTGTGATGEGASSAAVGSGEAEGAEGAEAEGATDGTAGGSSAGSSDDASAAGEDGTGGAEGTGSAVEAGSGAAGATGTTAATGTTTSGPQYDWQRAWQDYLDTDGAGLYQQVLSTATTDAEALSQDVSAAMQSYLTGQFAPYFQERMGELVAQATQVMAQQLTQALQSTISQAMGTLSSELSSAISQQLQGQMGDLTDALQEGFSVDADAFRDAIHFNMTQEDLTSLLTNYAQADQLTYESNLSKLGYADEDHPTEIDLYPRSFEDKDGVLDVIEAYNQRMRDEGKDDKVISYSDVMGTLMSSVTDIVNMISTVLIAFVSISLVVSSIMIAIITYISVIERRKEIGILRAMGASRLNVANVFNAETFIEGLISGVFAIVVVLVVEVPVNAYVLSWRHVPNIMALSPGNAAALILVSVALTVLAGLIPSSIAARRDPVEALRSE